MNPNAVASYHSSAYPVAAPARRVAPLTQRDRDDIAKFGRKGLVQRLRARSAAGWIAFTGTMTAGMLYLAASPIEDDTGLWITLASIPAMVIAGHQQSRLNRIRMNDPERPIPARAVRPGAIQPVAQDEPNEQLRALALVRGELLGTLPTLDVRFPEVAAQVRLADSQVYGALLQQAQALAALDQLSPQLPDHPGTAASRAEIRDRLAEGLAGYHQLLAETVLLLARSDAGLHSQDPLECARDLVATYSEGLRAAELLR